MRRTSIFKHIDWFIVFLFLALCLIGWASIYSAVYQEDHTSIFDRSQEYGKQVIWILTSLFLGTVILFTSEKLYTRFSWIIYGISMLSLLFVPFVGKEIGGARSWYHIGSFSLQPSEFAKFSTLLLLSSFLNIPLINLKEFKNQLIAAGIIGLPIILIMLQPDAGSALVYCSLIFALYREGLPALYMWTIFACILLFILALLVPLTWLIFAILLIGIVYVFSIKPKTRAKQFPYVVVATVLACVYSFSVEYIYTNVLKTHHRNRIDLILGKIDDNTGVAWNLVQSKIAIGSGGFSGKGYLEGTQTKFNFVPEQSTDFIFCTIGEEWGAIGSFVVIALFFTLICRIIIKAEKQRSTFSRVYGYGVACILFLHVFVNIGMTIGLVPVIGIPLPFLSYGGSSLWGFSILLFIFIRLDAQRKEIL